MREEEGWKTGRKERDVGGFWVPTFAYDIRTIFSLTLFHIVFSYHLPGF